MVSQLVNGGTNLVLPQLYWTTCSASSVQKEQPRPEPKGR